MSARIARTIALGVGAGALVLAAAGPAFADDQVNPYKVTVPVGSSVNFSADVDLTDPAVTCASLAPTWTVTSPGKSKQNAIVITGGSCSGTKLVATFADNTSSAKRNAVVKFVGTKEDGSKVVKTVVVKVAKAPKAPNSNKPS